MKTICLLLSATILITSCASTTLIQSDPPGADVYIDSQKKGTTPYNYSDTKIVGSLTNIILKKDGYQDFNVTVIRNERADIGAIIGGCFLLVPFFYGQWNMTLFITMNCSKEVVKIQEQIPFKIQIRQMNLLS